MTNDRNEEKQRLQRQLNQANIYHSLEEIADGTGVHASNLSNFKRTGQLGPEKSRFLRTWLDSHGYGQQADIPDPFAPLGGWAATRGQMKKLQSLAREKGVPYLAEVNKPHALLAGDMITLAERLIDPTFPPELRINLLRSRVKEWNDNLDLYIHELSKLPDPDA